MLSVAADYRWRHDVVVIGDGELRRRERAEGAVVGSAVGDALGAPFEFGAAEAFSARFPSSAQPVDEMRGGGGWEVGEATDDTQLALLTALSLLERGGFDPGDMFGRFQRWAAGEPKDIGLQTEVVLGSGLPWGRAAGDYAARHRRAAGNGSLMRMATSAVYFARQGRRATMDAGRCLSALTHGDPAAGEGCAAYHELLRVALDGGDPLDAVPEILDLLAPEHRDRWAVVLDPSWTPADATEFNGAVWPALGSAAWALRTTADFPEAIRAAIDLGGDTDTVAAITGGLAGAVYGIDAIPNRWRTPLFVTLPGHDNQRRTTEDLRHIAALLDLS